jgi:hypothetical protein
LAGLRGDYYLGTNFSQFVAARIDANVDYDWGTGAPSVPGTFFIFLLFSLFSLFLRVPYLVIKFIYLFCFYFLFLFFVFNTKIGVPTDGFSINWYGSVLLPYNGTYTFYVSVDDGMVPLLLSPSSRISLPPFPPHLSSSPSLLYLMLQERGCM